MHKFRAYIYRKEASPEIEHWLGCGELPKPSIELRFPFEMFEEEYEALVLDHPSAMMCDEIFSSIVSSVEDAIGATCLIYRRDDEIKYIVNLTQAHELLWGADSPAVYQYLEDNITDIIVSEVIENALSVPSQARVFINALGKVFGKVTENLKEMDDHLSKFLTSVPTMKLLYDAMETAMRSLFEGEHSEYFLEHLEKYCTEKERNEFWNAQRILRLNGMSHILVHRGEVIYFESNRKFNLFHEELVNGTAIY